MSEDPVQLAFDAFNAGRKVEAVAICQELVRAEARHAPALMLLGLVAEQENRFEEAAILLERSIAVESHPWSLITLAGCLWRLRRLADGLRYAERVVAEYPGFPEGHLVLANLLHATKRFDAALAQSREAKRLMAHSHLVEARLGCILVQLDRYEDAMRHFREAERLMPNFVHCRLIDYSRDLWEKIEPDAVQRAPSEHLKSGAAPVAATFCDAAYFYKYGATFMNSFAQNAGAVRRLHLHVVDADPELPGYVDTLMRRLSLAGVELTTEKSPAALAPHDNLRKTFYSCARFFHLNQLLLRYRTTIACFDIDTVFESPLDHMLSSLDGTDLGLIQREPPDSPWLDIVANIMVINNTDMALRYFGAVRNFIRHFGDRGDWFWHLDQIAMHCVLKMMERYDAPPNIGWISQDGGPVWHIGHAYDFKLQEARFSRYRLDGHPRTHRAQNDG